jgi:hypothetical protein
LAQVTLKAGFLPTRKTEDPQNSRIPGSEMHQKDVAFLGNAKNNGFIWKNFL